MNVPPLDLMAPLTEQTEAVLEAAHDEARRLENSHIAVEHLLLGIVRLCTSGGRLFSRGYGKRSETVEQIIAAYGLQPRQIEDVIRRQNVGFARRYADSPPLTFATDVQEALRLANDEVHWLDQLQLNVGHLLLGILLQPKGAAVGKALKLPLGEVRDQLRRDLPLERIEDAARHRSRYTPSARVALSLAQEETRRMHHDQVSTEHLLLGLLGERIGVAGRILKNLGVKADHVRVRTQEMMQVGSERQVEIIGLSNSYKSLLDIAGNERRGRYHVYMGTGHLLLNLVKQQDDVSVRALRRLNVKSGDILKQMEAYMRVQMPLLEGVAGGDLGFLRQPVAFTLTVQAVFGMALEEAERLEHRVLGTGHLLMGLMLEPGNLVAKLLQSYGLQRQRVRGLVELVTHRYHALGIYPMRLSDDVLATIKMAVDHAGASAVLDVPHVLLGLVSQTDSVAVKIMRQLKIDPQHVYQDILQRLD